MVDEIINNTDLDQITGDLGIESVIEDEKIVDNENYCVSLGEIGMYAVMETTQAIKSTIKTSLLCAGVFLSDIVLPSKYSQKVYEKLDLNNCQIKIISFGTIISECVTGFGGLIKADQMNSSFMAFAGGYLLGDGIIRGIIMLENDNPRVKGTPGTFPIEAVTQMYGLAKKGAIKAKYHLDDNDSSGGCGV